MHTRIDVLMCPHFWSLLPLSVFDWVVISVNVCDALMPLNTPIHPMSITSITLCTIFTGPSSFRLVSVSTVPDIEGLHHQKCIAARTTPFHSPVAHITILASLGGPQLIANGLNHG